MTRRRLVLLWWLLLEPWSVCWGQQNNNTAMNVTQGGGGAVGENKNNTKSSPPRSGPALQNPSTIKSDMPSTGPSNKPSMTPKTKLPTEFPITSLPTLWPTDWPSDVPSQQPSIACHDDSRYRSPINSFTCENHRGTNCIQWRFLGLSIKDVEGLVRSCPESCNIECGSFAGFEIKLSFQIRNVENYLSPESDQIMEQVSMEYLTNFVHTQAPDAQLFLYDAELLSQQIVRPLPDGSTRRIRHLQTDNDIHELVDLLVSVIYRGYAVDLEAETARGFLVVGLNSPGFTRAVQRSGDPFLVDAEITTHTGTETPAPVQEPPTDPQPSGPSSGAVAAIVIVVLFFIASLVGVLWLKHREQFFFSTTESVEDEKDMGSVMNSPADSNRSPLSQILSFDSLVRMVSPRTQESETSASTERTPGPESNLSQKSSGETTSSEEEEHPYTGIIPPMIVIDHIDDESEDWTMPTKHVKNVVPSKRMEASAGFREALSSGDRNFPHAFLNDSIEESAGLRMPPQLSPKQKRMMADLPHGSSSVCSDPLFSGAHDDFLDLRLAMSDGAVGDHDMLSSLGGDSPQSKHSRFSRDSRNTSVASWDSFPPNTSGDALTEDAPLQRSIDSTPARAASEGGFLPSMARDVGQFFPPLGKETPSKFFGPHWGRSPGRRPRRSFSAGAASPGGIPDELPRRATPLHRRTNSKSSASSSEIELSDNEMQLIFQAPRKGKLGLIIQCVERIGPIVVHVKDYSPLLGQVEPGDRLVNIDGTKTTQMTLSEVTALLSGRQAVRWTSTIRLVVVRSRMTEVYPTVQHEPFSYESSNDSCTLRQQISSHSNDSGTNSGSAP